MSFSEQYMTPSDAMLASYAEQADVDRAFADYDLARLTLHPRPAYASRNALLCVGCGGTSYTYNNNGSSEPGARVCNQCGVVQPGAVIFEQMFGRVCPTRTSNYKRIHHWHERISQLMLMESQIPADHMQPLLRGYSTARKPLCRKTLSKQYSDLGLQVYIEKWLQIIDGAIPLPGSMLRSTSPSSSTCSAP